MEKIFGFLNVLCILNPCNFKFDVQTILLISFEPAGSRSIFFGENSTWGSISQLHNFDSTWLKRMLPTSGS